MFDTIGKLFTRTGVYNHGFANLIVGLRLFFIFSFVAVVKYGGKNSKISRVMGQWLCSDH